MMYLFKIQHILISMMVSFLGFIDKEHTSSWTVESPALTSITLHEHQAFLDSTVEITQGKNIKIALGYVAMEKLNCAQQCLIAEDINAHVEIDGHKLFTQSVNYKVSRALEKGVLHYDVEYTVVASLHKTSHPIQKTINQTTSLKSFPDSLVFEGHVTYQTTLTCTDSKGTSIWNAGEDAPSILNPLCLGLQALH